MISRGALALALALSLGGCPEHLEPRRPDAAPWDGGGDLPSEGGTCELWLPGRFSGSLMLPGRACLGCHGDTLGPSEPMSVAGTVFSDVHQLDGCPGEAGVRVVIVDAEGTEASFTTNLAGNFYLRRRLVFPVRARLELAGRAREMLEAVDTGDCNSCHTREGQEGAPGRVVRPL